jgi:hypothetical protein
VSNPATIFIDSLRVEPNGFISVGPRGKYTTVDIFDLSGPIARAVCPDVDLAFLHAWAVPGGVLALLYAAASQSLELHFVRRGSIFSVLSKPQFSHKTAFPFPTEKVHAGFCALTRNVVVAVGDGRDKSAVVSLFLNDDYTLLSAVDECLFDRAAPLVRLAAREALDFGGLVLNADGTNGLLAFFKTTARKTAAAHYLVTFDPRTCRAQRTSQFRPGALEARGKLLAPLALAGARLDVALAEAQQKRFSVFALKREGRSVSAQTMRGDRAIVKWF